MELKENKNMVYAIWAFSIVVYAVVILLHYLPEADSIPGFVQYLPLVNATINGNMCCFTNYVAASRKKRKHTIASEVEYNCNDHVFFVFWFATF